MILKTANKNFIIIIYLYILIIMSFNYNKYYYFNNLFKLIYIFKNGIKNIINIKYILFILKVFNYYLITNKDN